MRSNQLMIHVTSIAIIDPVTNQSRDFEVPRGRLNVDWNENGTLYVFGAEIGGDDA